MSSNLPATTDGTPDLFSDARVQLIRDNIAKDAPENVFLAMLDIARRRGLDPLAKQISVIKYGNVWQVTTTIDGYRAIAESTGTYAGSDEPQFGPATIELANGKHAPEWASVTVWKFAHGQRVPFSERVYWEEYDGDNFTWKKMPRTMLAKVAESHALRKGFPKILSGLYTNEEMEQAGPVIDHDTGEIVEAPQTRQIGSGRAEPAGLASGDPEAAMKRLHATLADHSITHTDLHDYYAAKGFASLTDVPTATLERMARWASRETTASVQGEFARVLAPATQPALVAADAVHGEPGNDAYTG